MIERFTEENAWLSNFARTPFIAPPYYRLNTDILPFEWKTNEHFYQAAKCMDINDVFKIRDCPTPGDAKRLGGTIRLISTWEDIKEDVMMAGLDLKFQDPGLERLLLETGDEELQEGNAHGDVYWGRVWKGGKWVGENRLGELLMELRDLIR